MNYYKAIDVSCTVSINRNSSGAHEQKGLSQDQSDLAKDLRWPTTSPLFPIAMARIAEDSKLHGNLVVL